MKLSIIILYFKKVIGKVLYHLRKILKVLSYTAITIVLVDLLVFLMTGGEIRGSGVRDRRRHRQRQ